MAREIEKLSALSVARAKKTGYYSDGAGLYLQVGQTGTKSWVLRYNMGVTSTGKRRTREMGLGSLNDFSLAEARERARQQRQQLADAVDPIELRRGAKIASMLEAATAITFDKAAGKYIAAHRAGWRNPKHAEQWANTLKTYASPFMGSLPVKAVGVTHVLQALEPIWSTKTETATRVRGRIELVLDWATARNYRQGENPARWRGHLDKLLPKPGKVTAVISHPALPYSELGAFMVELREVPTVSSLALQFVILTATRTSEVLNAQWTEFDLKAGLWTIPAARMKAGKEHRVPLSEAALQVLEQAKTWGGADFVFPGQKPGAAMSNMSLLALLKRMKRPDLTVHGFRSTFTDWASERTNHSREVVEMSLAHAIESKVEAAYRRGDLFEKRAKIMADWAAYAAAPQTSAKVVAIEDARATA